MGFGGCGRTVGRGVGGLIVGFPQLARRLVLLSDRLGHKLVLSGHLLGEFDELAARLRILDRDECLDD